MTKKEFEKIVKESVSKSEVCRKIGLFTNGTGMAKVKKYAEEYNVSIEHFSHKAAINKTQRKYELIEKLCPVCETTFKTQKGHSREKTTCSHSCSNTHFRSGKDNPNYKEEKSEWGYRKICFAKWPKKCLICGFDKVVAVHHIDENHNNNSINNLVPMCPNHHAMIHTTKWGNIIMKKIQEIFRV